MTTRLDRIQIHLLNCHLDNDAFPFVFEDWESNIEALIRVAHHLHKLHRNAIARGMTMGAEFDKHELKRIELEMETPVVLAPLLEEV